MIRTIAVFLLGFTISICHAQKKDFSGTWKRVDELCTMSETLSITSIPVVYEVKQSSTDLTVTRTAKNKDGQETTYAEQLSFDGSAVETTMPNGQTKRSTIKWAQDGGSFSTASEFKDSQGNVSQTNQMVWAFAPDGKSLKATCDIQAGGKDYHWEAIFEKQGGQ